jgi:hypothetical protein
VARRPMGEPRLSDSLMTLGHEHFYSSPKHSQRPLDGPIYRIFSRTPGQGRNTVTGVAMDVLQEAGIDGVLRKSLRG